MVGHVVGDPQTVEFENISPTSLVLPYIPKGTTSNADLHGPHGFAERADTHELAVADDAECPRDEGLAVQIVMLNDKLGRQSLFDSNKMERRGWNRTTISQLDWALCH